MASSPSFRTIGEVFYRTRVLRGREWTLRRFAAELGIDHALLSFVEKGQRLPNEDLVRTLATIRGEDPRELLALLYRERMVRPLARELRRAVLGAGEAEDGAPPAIPAPLSPVYARALAALPDDGGWVSLPGWRGTIRDALRAELGKATRTDLGAVLDSLEDRGAVAIEARRVRKLRQHLPARSPADRIDLAIELSELFAKALTDKLVRAESDTYLRSHFLTLDPERMAELRSRLDTAIREVLHDFDAGEAGDGDFVRVLVAGTRTEGSSTE